MNRGWPAVFALLSGCHLFDPAPPYLCNNEYQCSAGRTESFHCIFDGDTGRYCAAVDNSCPSGLRWDGTALDKLAGQCVDPSLVTPQQERG